MGKKATSEELTCNHCQRSFTKRYDVAPHEKVCQEWKSRRRTAICGECNKTIEMYKRNRIKQITTPPSSATATLVSSELIMLLIYI